MSAWFRQYLTTGLLELMAPKHPDKIIWEGISDIDEHIPIVESADII